MQSPNDFFQMPFVSAITREISRHYLQAAGRTADAAALDWQPQLAPFPHPELSPGNAGYVLPPFIFVACMFATISFLSAVVSEKESGLRQALQTMGLQQGSYWISWWLFEALMAAMTAWVIIAFGEQQRRAEADAVDCAGTRPCMQGTAALEQCVAGTCNCLQACCDLGKCLLLQVPSCSWTCS